MMPSISNDGFWTIRGLVSGMLRIDTLLYFGIGVLFLVISLGMMVIVPDSTGKLIEPLVRVMVALAATTIAAGIPGLFELKIKSPGSLLVIRVTGALIVFLIVLAIHPRPNETAAAIEVALLFLTPFLIQYAFKRSGIRTSIISVVLLSVLAIIIEAAFFSQLVGSRTLTLPSQVLPDKRLEGAYLRGASREQCETTGCHQNLKILHGTPVLQGSDLSGKHDELHLLLDVEWNKWEGPADVFSRNYRGSMYFVLEYVCQDAQLTFYDSGLEDYSLKPGKDFLSWLFGFVEIPFSLDDFTVRQAVAERARENLLRCT